MDELTRQEISKVAATAAEALRLADQTRLKHEAHEDLCGERYKAVEVTLAQVREEQRANAEDLKDRVKMVGESLRQQSEALGQRQSNTATSIIDSVNQTVMGFKDLMQKGLEIAGEGVKTANAATAAFIHAQSETNKMLSEKAGSASGDAKRALDRVWQLGGGLLATVVLVAAYLYVHKGP